MSVTVKNNTNKFFTRLVDLPEDLMQRSYTFLKSKTPIKSGNARKKTKLQKKNRVIKSNYAYAGRLDEGWSGQAPKGFTDPTIKEMDKIVDNLLRGL